MKKIKTHNGKILEVPSSYDEDITEARYVETRSWRLLVESLDQFQQAEILFAERTEQAKQRCGVDAITPEVIVARQADPIWLESIADANYALKRMTAMASVTHAATTRLEAVRAEYGRYQRTHPAI